MKTFEQLINESLEKKPYELFKGPFIYFGEEGTAIKIKNGINNKNKGNLFMYSELILKKKDIFIKAR